MTSKMMMIHALLLVVLALLQVPSACGATSRGVSLTSFSSISRRNLDSSEDNEDSEDSDDDVKEPKQRECEVSHDTDEVEFACKAKIENDQDGSEIKDEIEFSVKTENTGLEIKVEYEQEIETENSETESETQYEIIFDRIVEYEKASNGTSPSSSEAYDWESDIVVQEISLQSWGDISEITESDDGVVSTFSVATIDDIVSFAFHISRAGDGAAITANKMKIDFRLTGFQWAQSDTYVALICSIESTKKVEVDYDDDDEDDTDSEEDSTTQKGGKKARDVRISFADAVDSTNGFVPFGEYTWANDAVVIDSNSTVPENNVTIEVVATSSPASSASDSIAFSFIGDAARSAADIYWDPEAGISYASDATPGTDTSSSSRVFLSAFGIVAGGICCAIASLV